MGHVDSDAATSKFKSKESELAKKKFVVFMDYFFLIDLLLKLIHLQMRLLGQDDLSGKQVYLYLIIY